MLSASRASAKISPLKRIRKQISFKDREHKHDIVAYWIRYCYFFKRCWCETSIEQLFFFIYFLSLWSYESGLQQDTAVQQSIHLKYWSKFSFAVTKCPLSLDSGQYIDAEWKCLLYLSIRVWTTELTDISFSHIINLHTRSFKQPEWFYSTLLFQISLLVVWNSTLTLIALSRDKSESFLDNRQPYGTFINLFRAYQRNILFYKRNATLSVWNCFENNQKRNSKQAETNYATVQLRLL